MTPTTHKASDLLNGRTFHGYNHVLTIDGQLHKVVALHRLDKSTAKYWVGQDPSDILLSVRPCVLTATEPRCIGPQLKKLFKANQELIAHLVPKEAGTDV